MRFVEHYICATHCLMERHSNSWSFCSCSYRKPECIRTAYVLTGYTAERVLVVSAMGFALDGARKSMSPTFAPGIYSRPSPVQGRQATIQISSPGTTVTSMRTLHVPIVLKHKRIAIRPLDIHNNQGVGCEAFRLRRRSASATSDR